mgnify:CR=1 FL=1
MSNLNEGTDVRSDDGLEQLLKKASPRPVPSRQDEDAARQAVIAEWQSVTGRRRSRQRVMRYAMVATVLLAVFVTFNMFRGPVVEAVHVASIEKSFGAIYLLGESAELKETRDLSDVLSGQTIVTGADAGLALAWGAGGSLRIDESSRVTFTNDQSIYLDAGRIYFDSRSPTLTVGITSGGDTEFSVVTDHGEVSHVGTQFMTEIDSDALTVSVREGRVAIDGRYHKHEASPGEQVTFAGRQRPTVLNIGSTGQGWGWISRTTPPADVDGKSLQQFLDWACRELGLELEFEGGAGQVAEEAILRGTIDIDPADALRLRLASAALVYRIDQGVLYVSDTNP